MLRQIERHKKTNVTQVAVPLVTAVWYNAQSHVPSPPVRTLSDETALTNFPESLAFVGYYATIWLFLGFT